MFEKIAENAYEDEMSKIALSMKGDYADMILPQKNIIIKKILNAVKNKTKALGGYGSKTIDSAKKLPAQLDDLGTSFKKYKSSKSAIKTYKPKGIYRTRAEDTLAENKADLIKNLKELRPAAIATGGAATLAGTPFAVSGIRNRKRK